jgi:hypothetical protein
LLHPTNYPDWMLGPTRFQFRDVRQGRICLVLTQRLNLVEVPSIVPRGWLSLVTSKIDVRISAALGIEYLPRLKDMG